MNILVCISKTPDTTAKIAFADNNTKFAGDSVQWIINPYDEWYALVRAIELKEADQATVIHRPFFQAIQPSVQSWIAQVFHVPALGRR